MKLLLHACCGPCSLEPTRLLLEDGHDITIAYMNSNIHPADEYTHRRDTLLEWAEAEKLPVVEGTYDPENWEATAGAIAADTTRPQEDRCRACYRLRFEEAARYAVEHGFDGISTTLSVSPWQFTEIIGEELKRAAAANKLEAVFQDFRPYYDQATLRSKELGMYRQKFCGCRLSEAEAAAEREMRKRQRKAAKLAKRQAAEAAAEEAAGNAASQSTPANSPKAGHLEINI